MSVIAAKFREQSMLIYLKIHYEATIPTITSRHSQYHYKIWYHLWSSITRVDMFQEIYIQETPECAEVMSQDVNIL